MDPDEALKNARAALAAYRKAQDNESESAIVEEASDELADAFEALDGWLSKKGFPPRDWDRSLDAV